MFHLRNIASSPYSTQSHKLEFKEDFHNYLLQLLTLFFLRLLIVVGNMCEFLISNENVCSFFVGVLLEIYAIDVVGEHGIVFCFCFFDIIFLSFKQNQLKVQNCCCNK